jgi:hypothetical protein
MDVHALLLAARPEIVDEACTRLLSSPATHYEAAGDSFARRRLADLFDLVVAGVGARDLTAVVEYSRDVAEERFQAGFDIGEVQTAFNSLEEAMWRRVVRDAPADQLADAIGLLSTVLGAGKDALARSYVSLASHRHVPTLDMTSMFAGTAYEPSEH